MNSEVPQHYDNSTFGNTVPPGYFSAPQVPFDVSSVRVQQQFLPVSNNDGDFNSMKVLNGNPVHTLNSEFDFSDPPGLNSSTDFATIDTVNLNQWPLGGQFPGQFNLASDFTGNLNPPSLLGSDIPIPCNQFGCFVTFRRDPDRVRHEAAVHGINQALHLCPVFGCNKSQGRGYTRKDKLTEHMWKKHGNLGYVKRT
jgi:hypothetical protein